MTFLRIWGHTPRSIPKSLIAGENQNATQDSKVDVCQVDGRPQVGQVQRPPRPSPHPLHRWGSSIPSEITDSSISKFLALKRICSQNTYRNLVELHKKHGTDMAFAILQETRNPLAP